MKDIRVGFFGEGVEVRKHPTLAIWCFDDGSVIREHKQARCRERTFGYRRPDDYCIVYFNGKAYGVHNLIAEAFHGIPKPGQTPDHLNRCRYDNRALNLKWSYTTEQAENRSFVEQRKLDVPAREKDDLAGYTRARRSFVKEHGHGYGRAPVIDDEVHRQARERNAKYRQAHKAEIKARNHEFYMRRKARNESR